ncbi:ABC transporter permease [Salinispira pacifica]|uniref:(GlcNAc)2 ABC transporter, permease component 1 n=1 Tax=Salinispira pacifica TaxID=1307761 RepID=V5WFZ2_9SPIO|nr:ABC transporter permease [Salinispira pacifica]AHC14484.1 (GlcNAc)2 ABC transporter, permease component 1 [Salinispira pacifica]
MKYIFKRLGFYLIAFIAAVTINFFLPRLMPGDPVQMYMAQLYNTSGTVNSETIAAVEKLFGFDQERTLIESYFSYIGNIFRGNWGTSFSQFPLSVTDALQRGLGWTVFLMGTALIVSFTLNTLLGIVVAWRRGSKLDSVLTVGGQLMGNIPAVVVALLLSFTFARSEMLGIFPSGYAVTPLFRPANFFQYALDVAYHAFLPVMSIVLINFGGIMGMRANMINQLGEDFITMGWAKGVPDRKVMFGYGARNAMLPVVTTFAMQIGFLLGGSLITEIVFNYPGLGKVMIGALDARDYPLMQGILLMSTILMLSANFLADIGLLVLDPRLRKQGR